MNEQETIAAGTGTLEPLVVHLSDSVTIIQGDCRAVLPVECDAIVTDPPYGIAHPCNFAGRGRSKLAACNDWPDVAGDDEPFDPAWPDTFGEPLERNK